jgi:hypothetical protein
VSSCLPVEGFIDSTALATGAEIFVDNKNDDRLQWRSGGREPESDSESRALHLLASDPIF